MTSASDISITECCKSEKESTVEMVQDQRHERVYEQ